MYSSSRKDATKEKKKTESQSPDSKQIEHKVEIENEVSQLKCQKKVSSKIDMIID